MLSRSSLSSVALASLIAAVPAMVIAADADAHVPCGKRGEQTIRHTEKARVFTTNVWDRRDELDWPNYVYGCFRGYRTLRFVGRINLVIPHTVRIAGRYAAFGAVGDFEPDPTEYTWLSVVDLKQGVRRIVVGGPDYQDFFSVALKPTGSIAWIEQVSDPYGDDPRPYQVRRNTGRRTVTLDTGHDIDPHSLRKGRSTVSWVRGGRRRSAMLP